MAAIVTAISLKSGSVPRALNPHSQHPLCNQVRQDRSKNELDPVVHAVAASNGSNELKLGDLQQVTTFVVTCFLDLLTL